MAGHYCARQYSLGFGFDAIRLMPAASILWLELEISVWGNGPKLKSILREDRCEDRCEVF